VIYFQFLKFLIMLYLGLGILSIPSMILYYSGNSSASLDPTQVDLKTALNALTLGNIGECKNEYL
jgi:hypothetical protein